MQGQIPVGQALGAFFPKRLQQLLRESSCFPCVPALESRPAALAPSFLSLSLPVCRSVYLLAYQPGNICLQTSVQLKGQGAGSQPSRGGVCFQPSSPKASSLPFQDTDSMDVLCTQKEGDGYRGTELQSTELSWQMAELWFGTGVAKGPFQKLAGDAQTIGLLHMALLRQPSALLRYALNSFSHERPGVQEGPAVTHG